MPFAADVRLAQLLCSRLCHDLVSPSGAVNAGLELLGDPATDAATAAEALALVKDSGRQLAARLAFFRAAFGSGTKASRLDEVAILARDFLAGGPVRVAGPEPEAAALTLTPEGVRAALGLLLVAAGALARGGAVSIAAARLDEGIGIALVAEGQGARLAPEITAALAPEATLDQATPRNIHALLAACAARAAGGAVELAPAAAGRVEIALIVPAAG